MLTDDRRRRLLLLSGGSGIGKSPYKRPLNGRLFKKTVNIKDPHRPNAVVNTYVDESGQIRRPLGWTDFCLARDWYDGTGVAQHNMRYGSDFYHYVRDFRRLGESDTFGYFAGRAVLMPWCIKAYWDAVEYGAQFDLRRQTSHGFQYRSHQERMDFEGAWAEEGQRRGLSKYIWLFELDNEYWQNSWLRWDLDKAKEEGYEVEKLLKSIMNPCPFICMGAPQSEGPDLILDSMLSDWVCEIHTARDRDWMVKHVHSTWYMEGYPGQLVITDEYGNKTFYPGPYYCYGEPAPMAGGPDDFMGTTDPGAQIAMLAMGGMCGGASTYFDGWDVKDPAPIEQDAPTLESFPLYMMNIPEDACTWSPVHGGSAWHWGKGNEFVTVLDEIWYGGYYPPRPIAKWTAYGCTVDTAGHTRVISGEGPLKLPSGFDGAVIKGEFA